MRGSMVRSGCVEKGIHIASSGKPDHLEIYQEIEEDTFEKIYNLVDVKIKIIEDELEISGYEYAEEAIPKPRRQGRASNREKYEYVEFSFRPQKKDEEEKSHTRRFTEVMNKIREETGLPEAVRSESGKVKYFPGNLSLT